MPTLKELVRSAHENEDLVVTGPHTTWQEMLEHEQLPSQAAVHHVIRVLLRQYKHPRKGRFSPSAVGECPRRVVFGFAGAPQEAPDIDSQEIMDHGSMGHLKWQLEGLTLGYMTAAEVWVEDQDLLVGGSMDAELEDASIFELKTAIMGVYNKIVLDNRAPKWEHLLQVHTYFLLSGADWASVVYEDRGTGAFHEFRVPRDAKIEREVLRRLASYKRYVEDDALPPMLDMCEQRIGNVYRRCPYRKVCHLATDVSTAVSLPAPGFRPPDESGALPEWATTLLACIGTLEDL